MWIVALRGLMRRRRRALLGVLSVGLVVAMFITVNSVSDSFFRSFFSYIYSTDADLWIAPSTSFTGLGGSDIDPDALATVEAVPGVAHAEAGVSLRDRAWSGEESAEVSVIGYEPDGIYRDTAITEGRMPDEGATATEVLLDESIRARFTELGLGDAVTIGGHEVTVVGFTSDMKMVSTAVAMMPIDSARQTFGLPGDSAGIVLAKVGEGESPGTVRGAVANALGDGYRVQTRDENIAEWGRQMSYIKRVLNGVSAVAVLVGALVITLIVYISVVERIREIGILKALGATDRSVRLLVVADALVIAVPGFVVGVVLSLGMARVIPLRVPITPALPVRLFVLAAAVTVLMSLVGSLVGMRRAVAVDPIEAVRTV